MPSLAAASRCSPDWPSGWFLHAAQSRNVPPIYHQLTFRRGMVRSARFTPNGQSVVYGAAWEGKPTELFITSPESPQSRSLERHGEELMSISSTGDIALLTNVNVTGTYTQAGTLARMPINGGDPRDILDGVQWADWSPDGKQLAIVRDMGGKNRLEFPIGKVIHETPGWISHPRVSPDGERSRVPRASPGRRRLRWSPRGRPSGHGQGSRRRLFYAWRAGLGARWQASLVHRQQPTGATADRSTR